MEFEGTVLIKRAGKDQVLAYYPVFKFTYESDEEFNRKMEQITELLKRVKFDWEIQENG